MADQYGPIQIPDNSSYSSWKWRSYIVYTTSATATALTITVKLYFRGSEKNWGQVGKYVSGSIAIGGSTVKSFSDGDQSWLFTGGNHLVLTASKTISRKTTSQSIAISGTVKVNSPSAYRNGNSSKASATQNVNALKTFTITYNGNGATSGGSGTLETRTYYYNQSTFSSVGLPDYTGGTWNLSKTNYNATGYWLKGSGVTSSATARINQSTTYATTQALYKAMTGNTWDGTNSITATHTMYAEWSPARVYPKLTTLKAYRVNNSSSTVEDPEGTTIRVEVYYTRGTLAGVTQDTYISVNGSVVNNQATASPYIKTISNCSVDSSYTITVSIYNKDGSTNVGTVTKSVMVPAAVYPIDLKVSGNNAYMGIMTAAQNDYPLTLKGFNVDGNITVRKHSTPIGAVENASLPTETNLPNTTWTTVCNIELSQGVWVVVAGVRISSNATGNRRACLTTDPAGTDNQLVLPAASGVLTQLVLSRIIQVESETPATYYLRAYQNSGSQLKLPASGTNYGNYITAVRIR